MCGYGFAGRHEPGPFDLVSSIKGAPQIRTTPSVLTDSMAAKVTREVAVKDSMLTEDTAPDSNTSSNAFISAACPLSPEKELVDRFRPIAHSSFLKFHMRAVFWSPNISRNSFSTAVEP